MRVQIYDPQTQATEQGGQELIDKWGKSSDTILWLDLGEATADETILLKTRFKIHPLALEDAMRDRHPPKLEKFHNFLFILLRGLSAETDDIDFKDITVALFVAERLLITRHSATSASTDWMWTQVSDKPALWQSGPEGLAVALIGRIVKRYVPILQALEPRLEILEKAIFEDPQDEMIEELAIYKSRLTKIRRILTYHAQVIHQLREGANGGFVYENKHELNDVHDHLDRSLSLAQMYYELSGDLIDSYISLASHRLNHIMQVLTIVTVIFVPLTFLAGIYGMNFENIPELRHRNAYFILLGVMLFVAVALLGFFRKKKWL